MLRKQTSAQRGKEQHTFLGLLCLIYHTNKTLLNGVGAVSPLVTQVCTMHCWNQGSLKMLWVAMGNMLQRSKGKHLQNLYNLLHEYFSWVISVFQQSGSLWSLSWTHYVLGFYICVIRSGWYCFGGFFRFFASTKRLKFGFIRPQNFLPALKSMYGNRFLVRGRLLFDISTLGPSEF